MVEVVCKNCGLSWVDCTCWDMEDDLNNGHHVFALRLHNKLVVSKYLQEKEFLKEED